MSGDGFDGRRILVVGGAGFVGSQPRARAARARAARGARRRQPALGRAREPAGRRARAPDRGLDQRRRGARRAAARPRLRLPPLHLPRQPELDGRPAGRPRAQHADHAQALRGAQGPRPAASASSTRRRAARWPRRPSRAPRPRRRTRRSRCSSTARTRSPRSSASTTPTTTSAGTGCRRSRRASRTSTGPARCSGAGRWRGTVNTVWRNVTPTFIYKALKHEALPVENGGIASRDFIYVDDMARGLIACALRGEPGEVYNLASGVETTIRELAELINELTGNPTPIALTPARDWDHSGQRYGDPTKARARARLRGDDAAARGPRAHDRVDAREPRADRALHRPARGADARSWRSVAGVSAPAVPESPVRSRSSSRRRAGRGPTGASCGASRPALRARAARRDVRYKQSVVGALWAVLQPVAARRGVLASSSGCWPHIDRRRRACRTRCSRSRAW